MYYNTINDGEKVLIDNQCFSVIFQATGFCLKNKNGILISGLNQQELCKFLNKKSAERVY